MPPARRLNGQGTPAASAGPYQVRTGLMQKPGGLVDDVVANTPSHILMHTCIHIQIHMPTHIRSAALGSLFDARPYSTLQPPAAPIPAIWQDISAEMHAQ